jgi:hypothetical protein
MGIPLAPRKCVGREGKQTERDWLGTGERRNRPTIRIANLHTSKPEGNAISVVSTFNKSGRRGVQAEKNAILAQRLRPLHAPVRTHQRANNDLFDVAQDAQRARRQNALVDLATSIMNRTGTTPPPGASPPQIPTPATAEKSSHALSDATPIPGTLKIAIGFAEMRDGVTGVHKACLDEWESLGIPRRNVYRGLNDSECLPGTVLATTITIRLHMERTTHLDVLRLRCRRLTRMATPPIPNAYPTPPTTLTTEHLKRLKPASPGPDVPYHQTRQKCVVID